jgi:para-aminobenzoate synthetase/4-amino-4-deoxychorismate lyase
VERAWEALAYADAAIAAGRYVAGYLSYELGAACNGLPQRVHRLPLVALGVYDRATEVTAGAARGSFRIAAPIARIPRAEYDARIARVIEAIRDGDVYQVNVTVPFDCAFAGDPFALFERLAIETRAPYAAYVEGEDVAIVSASPELFMRFEPGSLVTKPMKGTSPPDDIEPLRGAKNRAEHVMIVDLLRNDLHRLSDDVTVESLCDVERYPTFSTMTSLIRARFEKTPPLTQVVRAAFPCGSVTGAPKRAAMAYIAGVESDAREIYTGSVGYLAPNGTGWWNVAIRTLQVDAARATARFDAGGGIVADSTAAEEWDEIAIKTRFLRNVSEPITLLETFRIGAGAQAHVIDAHLERMFASARLLGIACDEDDVRARAKRAHERAASTMLCRLRLAPDGTLAIVKETAIVPDEPVLVCISDARVHSGDPMLAIKSTWRPSHERAWGQARARGAFDAILCNERGEITEGSRTTVFARIAGEVLTPPQSCGLLPGILRAGMLARGEARERILRPEDVERAEAIYIGNSARGLLPAIVEPA